ncbi:MAG: hypothetical protein AAGC60_05545 [Acidobacteriota bacterium]
MKILRRLLAWLRNGLDRLLTWLDDTGIREKDREASIPPLSRLSGLDSMPDSVEIFAMPGHGRTSFLWATVFMLRQLSRVWPNYLCWPLDEATAKSLLEVHEKLRLGQLPERWKEQRPQLSAELPGEPEADTEEVVSESVPGAEKDKPAESSAPAPRHALQLRNMNPWGDRHFIVSDRPDVVFNSDRQGQLNARQQLVRWDLPIIWLLSLADLDEARGRHLDLSLDELIRERHAAGEAARERPFKLIVVLTKGDAIPELPYELRNLLKEDPLANKLAAQEGNLFRANDEIDLEPSSQCESGFLYPEEDPLGYFEARRFIHERIRDWMLSNSSGRSLVRRAEELGVEVKFSLVSATGSGLVDSEGGSQLANSWTPRRVLDPYFWALEMGVWTHV